MRGIRVKRRNWKFHARRPAVFWNDQLLRRIAAPLELVPDASAGLEVQFTPASTLFRAPWDFLYLAIIDAARTKGPRSTHFNGLYAALTTPRGAPSFRPCEPRN